MATILQKLSDSQIFLVLRSIQQTLDDVTFKSANNLIASVTRVVATRHQAHAESVLAQLCDVARSCHAIMSNVPRSVESLVMVDGETCKSPFDRVLKFAPIYAASTTLCVHGFSYGAVSSERLEQILSDCEYRCCQAIAEIAKRPRELQGLYEALRGYV